MYINVTYRKNKVKNCSYVITFDCVKRFAIVRLIDERSKSWNVCSSNRFLCCVVLEVEAAGLRVTGGGVTEIAAGFVVTTLCYRKKKQVIIVSKWDPMLS